MQYKDTAKTQNEKVNFTFQVTIDKTLQTKKPVEAGIIVKRLGKISNQFTVTIYELAKFVTSPYSYTIAPALYSGAKKNENWISQQVWGLDFDNEKSEKITPEQAVNILLEHGIKANIIYTTFSDSPEKRKFRVVIVFDDIVTDAQTAIKINRFLEIIFNGAIDPACKDLARMFYGGRELLLENHEINKLSDLLEKIVLLNTNDNSKIFESNFEVGVSTTHKPTANKPAPKLTISNKLVNNKKSININPTQIKTAKDCCFWVIDFLEKNKYDSRNSGRHKILTDLSISGVVNGISLDTLEKALKAVLWDFYGENESYIEQKINNPLRSIYAQYGDNPQRFSDKFLISYDYNSTHKVVKMSGKYICNLGNQPESKNQLIANTYINHISKSLQITAKTGGGKTTVFIQWTFRQWFETESVPNEICIYVAPTTALTLQTYNELLEFDSQFHGGGYKEQIVLCLGKDSTPENNIHYRINLEDRLFAPDISHNSKPLVLTATPETLPYIERILSQCNTPHPIKKIWLDEPHTIVSSTYFREKINYLAKYFRGDSGVKIIGLTATPTICSELMFEETLKFEPSETQKFEVVLKTEHEKFNYVNDIIHYSKGGEYVIFFLDNINELEEIKYALEKRGYLGKVNLFYSDNKTEIDFQNFSRSGILEKQITLTTSVIQDGFSIKNDNVVNVLYSYAKHDKGFDPAKPRQAFARVRKNNVVKGVIYAPDVWGKKQKFERNYTKNIDSIKKVLGDSQQVIFIATDKASLLEYEKVLFDRGLGDYETINTLREIKECRGDKRITLTTAKFYDKVCNDYKGIFYPAPLLLNHVAIIKEETINKTFNPNEFITLINSRKPKGVNEYNDLINSYLYCETPTSLINDNLQIIKDYSNFFDGDLNVKTLNLHRIAGERFFMSKTISETATLLEDIFDCELIINPPPTPTPEGDIEGNIDRLVIDPAQITKYIFGLLEDESFCNLFFTYLSKVKRFQFYNYEIDKNIEIDSLLIELEKYDLNKEVIRKCLVKELIRLDKVRGLLDLDNTNNCYSHIQAYEILCENYDHTKFNLWLKTHSFALRCKDFELDKTDKAKKLDDDKTAQIHREIFKFSNNGGNEFESKHLLNLLHDLGYKHLTKDLLLIELKAMGYVCNRPNKGVNRKKYMWKMENALRVSYLIYIDHPKGKSLPTPPAIPLYIMQKRSKIPYLDTLLDISPPIPSHNVGEKDKLPLGYIKNLPLGCYNNCPQGVIRSYFNLPLGY